MLAKMMVLTDMATVAVLKAVKTAVHRMVESHAYLMVVVVGMHALQELYIPMMSEYVPAMTYAVSVAVMYVEGMVWETMDVVVVTKNLQ